VTKSKRRPPVQPVTLTDPSVMVAVSSAELKTLNSSPKMIVPAPGPGQLILPIRWAVLYKFGTTQYNNVNFPVELDVGSTGVGVSDNLVELFRSLESKISSGASTLSAVSALPLASLVDQPILFTAASDWTDGDGTATVIFEYDVVTI
jgi:hypothetical protein